MSFPVYAAMLSSQLIVTVGDHVPEFNVGPSCRESTVPDCQTMEKFARDKLIKDWPTFTARERAMCVMEEQMSGPPSYVGWRTCLEINTNARSPEASGSGTGAPDAARAALLKGKAGPAESNEHKRGGLPDAAFVAG